LNQAVPATHDCFTRKGAVFVHDRNFRTDEQLEPAADRQRCAAWCLQYPSRVGSPDDRAQIEAGQTAGRALAGKPLPLHQQGAVDLQTRWLGGMTFPT
jgi:hypothetical protein